MPLQTRMAVQADYDKVFRLWTTCFSEDGEEYPRRFLQTVDMTTQVCLGCVDGVPVTMLFLLPATARLREEAWPVRYLYAGCTHPAHRRCGYYKQLLTFAAEVAEQQEAAAIYLHPANQGLFAYYKDCGYRESIIGSLQPRDDGVWWEPQPRTAAIFAKYATEKTGPGDCLWIPIGNHTGFAEIMRENTSFTALLGE